MADPIIKQIVDNAWQAGAVAVLGRIAEATTRGTTRAIETGESGHIATEVMAEIHAIQKQLNV